MISSVVLIEGKDLTKDALSFSLSNAKQIVMGRVPGSGDWIVHIAAMKLADLEKALVKYAKVPGVTGVLTLLIRT
jgi:hypothetical protein